jgi:hypothetical protein
MNEEARIRIAANDKLLKAVITLLAIRDPDLLDDLDTIFALAAEDGHTLADADRRTRLQLKEELELIRSLASSALETAH